MFLPAEISSTAKVKDSVDLQVYKEMRQIARDNSYRATLHLVPDFTTEASSTTFYDN